MIILGVVGGHSQGNANTFIGRLFKYFIRSYNFVLSLNTRNCQNTKTSFLGTFTLHLCTKYHENGEKEFIPQSERSRLTQPLLRHTVWGNKEVQQPPPPQEGTWPSLMPSHPLTPPPSSYFYAVCAHIVSFLF